MSRERCVDDGHGLRPGPTFVRGRPGNAEGMAPTWKMLYATEGPFATVVADISLASESGVESLHALSQTIGHDLDELGAPPSVVDAVRARFTVAEHASAPRSRFVVASPAGVLVDEVIPDACSTPVVEWETLPDPGPLLEHETERTPVVLVEADRDRGGEVHVLGVRDVAGSTRVGGGTAGVAARSFQSGGLSHETWQPRSAPVRHDDLCALAEVVGSLLDDGPRLVVVTGDAAARREVVTCLGEVPVPVAELDAAGREERPETLPSSVELDELVVGHVRQRISRLQDALRDRIGRPEATATGVAEALVAVAAGRASALIVDREATGRRVLDLDEHDDLELGPLGEGSVRADLALLAAASITDTAVALLDAGTMEGHEVVALLR